MNRRNFISVFAGMPVVGGLVTFLASPLYRVLRPTASPYQLVKKVDDPSEVGQKSEDQNVAKVAELNDPWSSKDFFYYQTNVEYTVNRVQKSKIPGTIMRLPDNLVRGDKPEDKYWCVQRICVHLGCIFRYVGPPEFSVAVAPDIAASSFNHRPESNLPVFACPCHLSMYDPTQYDPAIKDLEGKEARGKVISGPAPRPPRVFKIQIKGDDIAIVGMEGGGIA